MLNIILSEASYWNSLNFDQLFSYTGGTQVAISEINVKLNFSHSGKAALDVPFLRNRLINIRNFPVKPSYYKNIIKWKMHG